MTAFQIYQVDAFTDKPFSGNPAAVLAHDEPLDDALMQNIATEMNLSETAFIDLRSETPLLRWFTPTLEIDLCGHATLASGHIYLNHIAPDQNKVIFDTKVAGQLTVSRSGLRDNHYEMNFPIRAGAVQNMNDIPEFVFDALSTEKPVETFKARDLMLVYEDPQVVLDMKPDFNRLMDYDSYIIATAPSHNSKYDFISRFFCADDGITEDPVTGSAHCTLAPYWAERLGKDTLQAYQASRRGGELGLILRNDRVFISGHAVTVLSGELFV